MSARGEHRPAGPAAGARRRPARRSAARVLGLLRQPADLHGAPLPRARSRSPPPPPREERWRDSSEGRGTRRATWRTWPGDRVPAGRLGVHRRESEPAAGRGRVAPRRSSWNLPLRSRHLKQGDPSCAAPVYSQIINTFHIASSFGKWFEGPRPGFPTPQSPGGAQPPSHSFRIRRATQKQQGLPKQRRLCQKLLRIQRCPQQCGPVQNWRGFKGSTARGSPS